MNRLYSVIVLLILIMASAAAVSAQDEKQKVLFIAPIFNIQGTGMSVDAIEQIGHKVMEIVEERTGCDIEYEKVGDTSLQQQDAMGLTIERLKKGGDMSWLDFPTYRKAMEAGVPIKPLAIMEIGGELTFNNCLYVKKGTPFKTLEDLRGKTINGGMMMDWVALRLILHSNGVGERPDEFFGELAPINTVFSAFNFLLMGKIDAFVIDEPLYNLIRRGNPNYEKVQPLVCAEGSSNTLLPIYREGLAPEVRDMFREILTTAHSDPAFGMIQPFIEAAGIRFIEVSDETLESLDEGYNLASEKGWFAEADKYYDDFEKNARKRKLQKCMKNCTGSTAEKVKACYKECEDKYSE